MQALTHEGAEDRLREAYYDRLDRTGHDFNLALLCCLPKKASGNDQEHGDFYEAGNTRPLALVNLDNRILASAARIAWEPILEGWVSGMQRGFLTGRVMLHNVLEVDYESMCVSLKCDKGSLVLFDFSAAFHRSHMTSCSKPCATSGFLNMPFTSSKPFTTITSAILLPKGVSSVAA